MPVIKSIEHQTQVSGPVGQRRATGEDFGAGISASVARLGTTALGAADVMRQREERAEISDLNAKMAKTHADYTVYLQEQLRSAQPGDTGIVERVSSDLERHLEAIDNGLTTKKGRQNFAVAAAQMRGHFVERAAAGQAELAKIKVKQDYATSLNSLSSSLIEDPSSFDSVLAMHDAGLKALTEAHNVSPAEMAALQSAGRTELAKSAALGLIQIDPALAKKEIESGKYDAYIDGTAKATLLGRVDQEFRAREVEAERRRRAAEREKDKAQMVTQDELLSKMVAGTLTAKEVLASNLDPFGSGSKEQFLQLMRVHNNSEKLKTDPATFTELFRRITLPDDDPRKIRDENELNQYVGAGLTFESFSQLRSEVQGKRTAEGAIDAELKQGIVKAATSALTATNAFGIRDPKGDELLLKFMTGFLPEWDKQRKAGVSPYELADPNSPKYLGKAIQQYRRSPAEMLRDQLRDVRGPAGASPLDILNAPKEDYKSADEVRRDYNDGKITRDQATKILRDKGWAR